MRTHRSDIIIAIIAIIAGCIIIGAIAIPMDRWPAAADLMNHSWQQLR